MKARRDSAAVLMLILPAVIYFYHLLHKKLLLCGATQFATDFPLQSLILSYFFSGNLPRISFSITGGHPLWADATLGNFYPGNLIYLFLPLPNAWNAALVLHAVWGMLGVYWISRKWKAPVPAAIFGAYIFGFLEIGFGLLNDNALLISVSWIPWVVGLVHFAMKENIRKTVLAAFAIASQWLSSWTLVQPITLVIALIVGLVAARRTNQSPLRLVAIILAAASIAAIQWVPSVFWLSHARGNPFSIRSISFRLPKTMPIAQLYAPPPIVQQMKDLVHAGLHCSGESNELSPYSGLRYGLTYPTATSGPLLKWNLAFERGERVDRELKMGQSLNLARQAGVQYVVSDFRFSHPELALVRQKRTQFYLFKMRSPPKPLVEWRDEAQPPPKHQELTRNSMIVTTNRARDGELVIHRNAVPGWKCTIDGNVIPLSSDTEGWMTVRVPSGQHDLRLIYHTPGEIFGAVLSGLGVILMFALLIL
jgi:Bacterial membrane protein YfhO